MVTGAASGIGAGIAERFINMGDQVIALDNDETGLLSLASRLGSANLLPFIAGVTNGTQVKKALAEVVKRVGHPEVLINNPGTTGGSQATTLHATPPEVVDHVLDVNLRAIIRLCTAVLPAMLERGRGVIVNIASVAGLVAFPARAAYSISKAAVIQITRTIAVDYGHRGIRSVALCPGIIDTPMTTGGWQSPHCGRKSWREFRRGRSERFLMLPARSPSSSAMKQAIAIGPRSRSTAAI
jgi:NAD(P)-dependent dehydrogenase (short-subunit alcohol dehydrogenase family)